MATVLRAYGPADLAAMQSVRKAAFAPVFQSFRALVGPAIAPHAFATPESDQGKLLNDLCADDPGRVIVAEEGGRVVGFVAYRVNEETKMGEIGLNAVDPRAAGRGIGAAMYAHVLELMRRAGVRAVEVSTGLDASHAPARRAYEKAGFTPKIEAVTYYREV